MALKLAVLIGQKKITHAEMQRNVSDSVDWLRSVSLRSGAWVGVALQNDYQHWVITLALLRLGHPCASTYDIEGMPQALRDRFAHWIVDAPLDTESGWIQPPQNLWQSQNVKQEVSASLDSYDKSGDGFQFQLGAGAKRLILTSGTTGLPKVVGFSAELIQSRLKASSVNYAEEFNASTCFLSFMGLDTVSGFFYNVLTWIKGGVVLFGEPTADGRGRRAFPISVSNVITAAPARLQELVRQSKGAWPGHDQRVVLSAGSRLHSSVRDQVQKIIGSRVINTYGSTEAGSVAICNAQLLDEHPGAAGYLPPGVQVEIVASDGTVLPHGKVGRLRCKTPGMAQGYEGEEKSAQFEDGWFYPGDLAVLRADGWLIVTGRNSDVINLGGKKLSAVEMESRLHNVDVIEDVCVMNVDIRGKESLAVAVVCLADADRSALRQKLAEAMGLGIAFHLVFMDRLPRNAMGKLPRQAIAQHLSKTLTDKANPRSNDVASGKAA